MNLNISNQHPKVTIITTVLNAVNTIEQTIWSVIGQSYDNIEYLIIDGGSTDGTLEVIRRYQDKIALMISEPDKGIADGFNKGIARATGEWIGLINADDWYTPDAVKLMVDHMEDSDQVCCGNLLLIGDDGFRRLKKSKTGWLNFGMYIMHPTCFVKKDVYQSVGGYDPAFKIAMDFDMFLRIKRKGYAIKYVDEHVACMRTFGVSNDVRKMHKEELVAMKNNLSTLNFLISGLFNYLNRLRWRLWYNDPFRNSKSRSAF